MRLLAKEVLAEVPDQVTSFMRLHGLKPGQPTVNTVPQPNAPYQPNIQSTAFFPQQPGVNSTPYPSDPNNQFYDTNGAINQQIQQQVPTKNTYGLENLSIKHKTPNNNQDSKLFPTSIGLNYISLVQHVPDTTNQHLPTAPNTRNVYWTSMPT